jgi:hypothetical protein
VPFPPKGNGLWPIFVQNFQPYGKNRQKRQLTGNGCEIGAEDPAIGEKIVSALREPEWGKIECFTKGGIIGTLFRLPRECRAERVGTFGENSIGGTDVGGKIHAFSGKKWRGNGREY